MKLIAKLEKCNQWEHCHNFSNHSFAKLRHFHLLQFRSIFKQNGFQGVFFFTNPFERDGFDLWRNSDSRYLGNKTDQLLKSAESSIHFNPKSIISYGGITINNSFMNFCLPRVLFFWTIPMSSSCDGNCGTTTNGSAANLLNPSSFAFSEAGTWILFHNSLNSRGAFFAFKSGS